MSEKKAVETSKKSYYEELHEKMEGMDYSDYQSLPSGSNGFGNTERKFGYVLCCVFLGILTFFYAFGFFAWLTRERELTVENYREYFTVEVSSTTNANWDSFLVTVKPNEKMKYTIFDLSVVVEISFENMIYGENVKQVRLSSEKFKKGDMIETVVEMGQIGYFQTGVKVLAVSGRT